MKRRRHAATGVLIIAVPLSAGAVAAGRAVAQVTAAEGAGSADTIQVNLRSRHVAYRHDVVLSGRAPTSDAGHTFELDFAAAGSSRWSRLASGAVRGDGTFALRAPVKQSGLLRVLDASAPRDASGGGAFGTTAQDAPSSPIKRVSVAATFRLRPRSRQAVGGQPIHVAGRLLPAVAGRRVALQGRSNGHWRMLATARTHAGGRFDLRYSPTGLGRQRLR